MSEVLQQASTTVQGRARSMRARIVFGDDATSVTMGTLPIGTLVYGMYVNVETAFNGGGTDLLEVGTSLDPDAYVKTADVDLTTAPAITASSFTGAAAFPQVLTVATTVTAIYNDQNNDATTGALTVTILYVTSGN